MDNKLLVARSVKLDPETDDKLKKLAFTRGVTTTELISMMVSDYLQPRFKLVFKPREAPPSDAQCD